MFGRKESRADRKHREYRERLDTDLKDRFQAAERAVDQPLMQFLTQGEAIVELWRHAWTATYYRNGEVHEVVDMRGFEWRCGGCDMTGAQQHLRLAGHGYEEYEPHESRKDANAHAAGCRAMTKPEV